MTDFDTIRTLTATIDSLFDAMEPDPEKPAELDSVWRFASLGSRAGVRRMGSQHCDLDRRRVSRGRGLCHLGRSPSSD